MIKLTVLVGPDMGSVFTPSGDPIVIGRGNDCDVVLHDSTMSRRHCMIQCEGTAFVISDLRTTNGIFLNDPKNRINGRHVLRHEDEILFGRSRLRVELPAFARKKSATIVTEPAGSDPLLPEGLDGNSDASQISPVVLPSSWQSAMTVVASRPQVAPPPPQIPVEVLKDNDERYGGVLARMVAGVRQVVGGFIRFMSGRSEL